MHSIQNISERNKIDTQSRADAYIRRKRLIRRKSDYNLKHLKVFLKLKNPKNSLFWENIFKQPKKTQKPPQKTHWAGFFF
jgi:hypothetical protein